MLDLEPRHLATVKNILGAHVVQARVWAFGSRATGHAQRFSDLDLAIEADAELTLGVVGSLREAFSESDLPIMVDVLDLHAVSPEFRHIIEQERILIA